MAITKRRLSPPSSSAKITPGRRKIGGRVGMRRFKLIDKLKAFELYGKAMGFYTERQELAGKNGEPLSITVEFVEATHEREAAIDTSPLTRNGNIRASSTMPG